MALFIPFDKNICALPATTNGASKQAPLSDITNKGIEPTNTPDTTNLKPTSSTKSITNAILKLPLPSGPSKYSKEQVQELGLDYKFSDICKAINNAKCRPQRSTVQNWIEDVQVVPGLAELKKHGPRSKSARGILVTMLHTAKDTCGNLK